MNSVLNKKELIIVFSTSNSSNSVDMIGEENSVFKHEEADGSIISSVWCLIHEQKQSIQVIAVDTDVFVLLVYFCWKWQAGIQIQSGHWYECHSAKLGHKCSQLLAVQVNWLWHCKLHFGKGKVSAVTIIQKHDINFDAFDDPRADLGDVLKTGYQFVCLLYKEQNVVTSMNQLRHEIFSFQWEEHPKD